MRFLHSFGFLVLLLVWFLLYLSGIFNILIIPSPIDTTIAFFELLFNNFFDILATMLRVIVSFIFSAIIGITLGLIIGFYPILNKTTEKLIDFFRSIPGIALFPLFILFFGVSETSRLLVSIFATCLIVLLNTKYGVIYSNKYRKNLPKLHNLSRLETFRRIILPEASPYIFTGLRVAVSLCVIIIIVTEMLLGTNYGMGFQLVKAQMEFDTPLMFSLIIALGLIGSGFNYIFSKIETKIFHWR